MVVVVIVVVAVAVAVAVAAAAAVVVVVVSAEHSQVKFFNSGVCGLAMAIHSKIVNQLIGPWEIWIILDT